MGNNIVVSIASAADDTTLPINYRDKIMNAGSLRLFDFADAYSWNPSSAVVNGAAITNFVDGAPAASLVIGTPGDIVYIAGKGFQINGALNSRILLDTGLQYYQNNLTDSYLEIVWATLPAIDGGSNTGYLLTKQNGAGFAPAGLLLAVRNYSTKQAYGKLSSTTNNQDVSASGAALPALNGKHQFAVSHEGSNATLFVDGAVVATATGVPALTAINAAMALGAKPSDGISGTHNGIIFHRNYNEDLTISGNSAASVVANDYSLNNARFS